MRTGPCPFTRATPRGFPHVVYIDIKINVSKIIFAILPSNGIRTVKRQNGNGKRCSFQPQRACATPTFSDWTTVQYESSEAHFDTLRLGKGLWHQQYAKRAVALGPNVPRREFFPRASRVAVLRT